MALRLGYGGLSLDAPAESRLLDALGRIAGVCMASVDGVRTEGSPSFPYTVNKQLRTGADKGNPTV